jgi:hypothetical protein
MADLGRRTEPRSALCNQPGLTGKGRCIAVRLPIGYIKEWHVSDYLRAESPGRILRNAGQIYRTNFGVLFFAYLLPVAPFAFLFGVVSQSEIASYAALFAVFLVSQLSTVPLTAALADICLGNRPSVARAYRRAFGRATGQVVGVALLVGIIVLLGFVLFVVPGILFSLWFSLAPTVAVLERISGWRALKRSKELGSGYYARNFKVLFLAYVVVIAGSLLLGGIIGVLTFLLGLPTEIMNPISSIAGIVLAPIPLIAMILLYYDLRVRKEAYDNAALAEDLKR